MKATAIVYPARGWIACLETKRGNVVATHYPPFDTEDEAQEKALSMLREFELAKIGAMILEVNDMVGELKSWQNSQIGIAAAILNQARSALEDAVRDLQQPSVRLRMDTEVDGTTIRLRIRVR